MRGPISDGAKMTERLRRPNYGTLEVELSIDDPRPTRVRDGHVPPGHPARYGTLDEICLENEKSWQRMQPGSARSQGGRAN